MSAPIIESPPAASAAPRVARGTFEAAHPSERFDFGGGDEWRVVVTAGGVPCAYPHLASPGDTAEAEAAEALLGRQATTQRRREAEIETLRARLGAVAPRHPHPDISVVVCTRRRRAGIRRALETIAELDPAPFEVIVVDNDPGDENCRDIAEQFGARYEREEIAGLDRARRRGLVCARGEVVAYCDDDCLPPPGWLARAGAHFSDPTVGAVTGPAFATNLDSPARLTRERVMAFVFGLTLRRHDWSEIQPVLSGATGAGANMMFRRELALSLGEIFPLDLDLGTPTRGGGDLFALYSVLAAGRRVVHEPAAWLLHDHPPESHRLTETAVTWGLGFTAFLAKVLAERRELPALTAWWWLVREYSRTVIWTLPAADPVLVHVKSRYLFGGLRGLPAWVSSRRLQARALAPDPLPPPRRLEPDLPVSGVEIIRAEGPAERNAAARASRADVLVFLDPRSTPLPGFSAAHAAAHRHGPPAVVIGSERARDPVGGLAAQMAAQRLDHHDHLRATAVVLTASDARWSNLSIRRDLFHRLGGFDETLSGETGAQALAAAALGAGAVLRFEGRAAAVTAVGASLDELLGAARQAGRGAAELARRHGEFGAAVDPAVLRMRRTRPLLTLCALAFRSDSLRCGIAPRLGGALEWMRLRRSWLAVAELATWAEYAAGWRESGGERLRAPVTVIELDSADAVPPPTVASPLIEVRIAGRPALRLRPRHGCWHGEIADQILDGLTPADLRELALARDGMPPAGTGARVSVLRPGVDWRDLDLAIRASDAPVAAVPLPGVEAGPDFAGRVERAFAGERVALALGTGLPPGEPDAPVWTFNRRMRRRRYDQVGPGAQYVAVTPAAYRTVGGFDPQILPLGPHAAMLDLVERILDAGLVVAHADVGGLSPPGLLRPTRSALKWQAARSRGRLLARVAGQRGGGAGAWFLLVNIGLPQAASLAGGLRARREPSLRHAAGMIVGLSVGAAEQLLRERMRR